MAELPKRFNNVSFFPQGGTEVFLTLETDWVISAGDKPNINVATIPAPQFDQIASASRTGTVNFYFNSDPGDDGDPDVTLESITIVDIQPGRIGVIKQIGGGEAPVGMIDYRVSFADVRHQLVPPRGGVLTMGDVNQEPFTGPVQNGAPTLQDNFELIHACLEATGQSFAIGDGDFQDLPPMRSLKWYGARAPEELSKVLQWVGGVLYVTSDGSLGVDLLGSGNGAPDIDAEDLLASVQLPAIDRRGKTVVFVSAPTAAQQIYSGGSADDSDTSTGDGNGQTWNFVARDSDGSWQTLDDNSLLDGLDIEEEIGNGFADVDEQYRAQLQADVYYCMQLDTDTYNPLYASLLKQASRSDGFLDDITASGSIARRNAQDGTWANTKDDVNIHVTHVYGGLNILRFGERLAQVDPSPTLDPDGNIKSIQENGVTVNFAMESAGDDGTGKGYFACGFTRASEGDSPGLGGSVQPLTADQVTSALQGGDDIVILHSPAMRLRQLNGETKENAENFGDLQSQCQALADQFLAGSGDPPRLIVARGFYEAELSGVVSEIRYSQSEARTTIRVNSWFAPATAFQVDPSVASKLATARTAASGGAPGGEPYPQQAATAGERASMGASDANQPVHTVAAVPPPIIARYDCAVQISGPDSAGGTGVYDGKVTDVPLNPDPAEGVQITFEDAKQALILNIGEKSGRPPTIPADIMLPGMRGPVLYSGKQVVWTYYDPTAIRSFQFINATDGSGNKLFQLSTYGSIYSPPPATDPSWVTALTFEPCPGG